MPRIPDAALEGIIYLYPSVVDAQNDSRSPRRPLAPAALGASGPAKPTDVFVALLSGRRDDGLF
jgi:hypothetical protein